MHFQGQLLLKSVMFYIRSVISLKVDLFVGETQLEFGCKSRVTSSSTLCILEAKGQTYPSKSCVI